MSATIYLKDLNVVVETVKEKKLIPTRRFSIDPNQDNMNIWDEKEYNKTFHFSEVTGKDSNGVDLPAFTSIQELEDYLSPFVNFKNGGDTGNNGGVYEPSIEIDFFTPISLDSSLTTPQRVVVNGSFLDYVNSVSFSANSTTGISVSLISSSFNKIELDVVCSSVLQDINITLTTPKESKNIVVSVKQQRVIIPSNSGTGESLWKRGSTNGNQAITGTGTFEAENNGGNGWNEHAYYGPFSGTVTEIQHEFVISRLNAASNAYVYIHLDNTSTATSGNVLPRFQSFQGGSDNDFINIQGNTIALPVFQDGDKIGIKINALSAQIILNDVVVLTDSGDYSSVLSNVNLSFTAFRVFSITDLKTTIIE